MPWPTIDSPQNEAVKTARQLHAAKGRQAQQRLWVEGSKALEAATEAGLPLHHLFVDQRVAPAEVAGLANQAEQISSCGERVMKALSTTESPVKVAGVVGQPGTWAEGAWSPFMTPPDTRPQLLLVLDGLQDPGNVGTLLRSALAFGVSDVLALPGTADPYSPKALRSSTGLVFRLPRLYRCEQPTAEALQRLTDEGVQVFLAEGQASIKTNSVGLASGWNALVLGQEGQGLRLTDAEKAAYPQIAIPMAPTVESLNAAVSGSILLADWQQARQEAGKPSYWPTSG